MAHDDRDDDRTWWTLVLLAVAGLVVALIALGAAYLIGRS